jgi:hypothetical protein
MLEGKLPGMLFGFGFIGSTIILLTYLLLNKLFPELKINKKLLQIIIGFCIFFFFLGLISGVVNVIRR